MESTQEAGLVHPAHQLGKVAYTLNVPALSFDDYVRMQRLLLRPDLKSASCIARKRSGRIWNWKTWILVVIGGSLGWAAGAYDLSAELWIGVEDSDAGWLFGGLSVILLALGLMLLSVFFGVFYLSQTQRLLLGDIHAAGGGLFGAHQLQFGDGGILLHNASRSSIVPWSVITEIVADKGVTFIIADRISAYWLPESLLAAMPDRDDFMRYLEQQSGLYRLQ
ncbi:YcxB family protein [Pigmentiphaga aceris]|uniref:YcxB family protein n=1 Tax=Pigmentiphaga aceris TaxID=1940612 RepID=A0A5C0B5T8_9BURK|nr:YcxB family protein [Pigmentiphaga aceris]QEI08700.1 YcxB family protein [Pigmentiphaga aceris]